MSPYLITNNIFSEVLRFLRGRASPVKHTCALMVRLFQRRTPRPKNIALPEDCFTVVCEFVPSLAMLRGHNHGPIRVDWLEGELLGGFLTVWVKGCWRRWRRWRRRPPRLLLHLFQCANRRGKLSSELRPRVRRVPVGGRSSFGGRRRHSVALQSVKQRQGIITTSGHPKPQRGTSRRAPPAPPGLFISSAKKKAPRKLCFSPPNLRDLRDLVSGHFAPESPSAREQVPSRLHHAS